MHVNYTTNNCSKLQNQLFHQANSSCHVSGKARDDMINQIIADLNYSVSEQNTIMSEVKSGNYYARTPKKGEDAPFNSDSDDECKAEGIESGFPELRRLLSMDGKQAGKMFMQVVGITNRRNTRRSFAKPRLVRGL